MDSFDSTLDFNLVKGSSLTMLSNLYYVAHRQNRTEIFDKGQIYESAKNQTDLFKMLRKEDRLQWVVVPKEEAHISLKVSQRKEHPDWDDEWDEFWEECGYLLVAALGLGCVSCCSLLCCARCYLKRNARFRQ